jgi:gamma-glutamyl-gamma-aminobutyrate hydrolase PuuD
MRIIAWSDDGVQEAAERIEGGFGLFVQWHPESGDDRAQRDAIYGALVQAAAKQR